MWPDHHTEHDFDKITFFKKTPKIHTAGGHFGAKSAPKGGCFFFVPVDDNLLTSYKVYPNPFIDVINLLGTEGDETIIINDILGKEIFKGVGVEEINLSGFEKGTYFLTLSKGSQSSTFKVIKK